MTTIIIHHNGSRFLGAAHASIDALLELMELEPIDFKAWGTCINISERGRTIVRGNFVRVAHGFSIETDDKELLTAFYMALNLNATRAQSMLKDKHISERAKELLFDRSIPSDQLGKPFESIEALREAIRKARGEGNG